MPRIRARRAARQSIGQSGSVRRGDDPKLQEDPCKHHRGTNQQFAQKNGCTKRRKMLNQRRLRRGTAILALLSACAIIPQYLAPAAAAPKEEKPGWTRIGARPEQKSHAAALMSDTPATCTLLLGLFAFFAVIRVKRWTGDTVGASAESIEGRQYWRLVTSNLAHIDSVHFVFNLSTAYSLGGALERRHGSAALLWSTAALVVFVGLVAASLTRHAGGAVGAWHLGFSVARCVENQLQRATSLDGVGLTGYFRTGCFIRVDHGRGPHDPAVLPRRGLVLRYGALGTARI